jgi:hypothetical protein
MDFLQLLLKSLAIDSSSLGFSDLPLTALDIGFKNGASSSRIYSSFFESSSASKNSRSGSIVVALHCRISINIQV